MKKRKLVTTVLIVISLTILVNLNLFLPTNAESVPAPKLVGYTPEGFSIDTGTFIIVNYSVPRFSDIDGVLLVGEGSGLTTDINSALELNYSHSYRDKTYYEGTFNLTENTQFKAYSWDNEVNNGTYEELDILIHKGAWHYIYARDSIHPPYLDESKVNIEQTGPNSFLAEENQTVVLKYIVRNGDPDAPVTLGLSVYRDKISNGSLTDYEGIEFLDMEYETNDTGTGFPQYTVSFNVTNRTVYFAANNSVGWDIDTNTGELEIYRIDTGFYFESEPEEDLYTDVEDVHVIIRTINETENDAFGLRYQVAKSSTNDSIIKDWTEVAVSSTFNETITTNEDGWNTTIKEYKVNIGSYNVDNIVYYEAYNTYFGEIYNETEGNYHKLTIYSSIPEISLLPKNNRYFNYTLISFNYSIELVKGEIDRLLIDFGDGDNENITDFEQTSTTHNYTTESNEYNVTLYVNTTLGTTNSKTHLIVIDLETPTGEISSDTTNTTLNASITGFVEVYFSYEDNYGIQKVWIHWGDGTVWNATNDNYASHSYLKSGDYEVWIKIVDFAGNTLNLSIIFTIEFQKTETETTPYIFTLSLFSILITTYVLLRRKK